jgi:hypothetical protein
MEVASATACFSVISTESFLDDERTVIAVSSSRMLPCKRDGDKERERENPKMDSRVEQNKKKGKPNNV